MNCVNCDCYVEFRENPTGHSPGRHWNVANCIFNLRAQLTAEKLHSELFDEVVTERDRYKAALKNIVACGNGGVHACDSCIENAEEALEDK